MTDKEKGFKWWLRYIIVPLIAGSGLVTIFITLMGRNEPDPRPSNPTISISDDVRDAGGNQVDKNQAPFKIRVDGEAMNAKSNFVYLVVDNGNDQYIEPTRSLGAGVEGPFSGYCYLGELDDPSSLGQSYRVFAVVVNRAYSDYNTLDNTTVLAKSVPLLLVRTQ